MVDRVQQMIRIAQDIGMNTLKNPSYPFKAVANFFKEQYASHQVKKFDSLGDESTLSPIQFQQKKLAEAKVTLAHARVRGTATIKQKTDVKDAEWQLLDVKKRYVKR